ncbi:hypothetical protein BB560_005417, partial [Smittium megazygosporum]
NLCPFLYAKRLAVLIGIFMKPLSVVRVSVCASISRISSLRPSSNCKTSADSPQSKSLESFKIQMRLLFSSICNVQCSATPVKRENINTTLVFSDGYSYRTRKNTRLHRLKKPQ